MKKGVCFSVLILSAFLSEAQNIQLHYDLGKGRGYLTSTVEMFKPDKLGSTFFFIDMDYNSVPDKKGVTLAYWEIARALRFWESPLAFHTEYNGGFGQWKDDSGEGAFQIESAFLNGFEYTWENDDFSRGMTFQVLHKYIRGKHNFSFQLTGVWHLSLFDNKLSFTGFADFWRETFQYNNGTTKFCFLSEPQFWINLNKNFAIGNETELNYNCGGLKGFHVFPTVGAKYTF